MNIIYCKYSIWKNYISLFHTVETRRGLMVFRHVHFPFSLFCFIFITLISIFLYINGCNKLCNSVSFKSNQLLTRKESTTILGNKFTPLSNQIIHHCLSAQPNNSLFCYWEHKILFSIMLFLLDALH